MIFNFENAGTARKYNNTAAWAVLMGMMTAMKWLKLSFYVTKSKHLAVFVEVFGTEGFTCLCTPETVSLIREHLIGNAVDFGGVNPEALEETEETTNELRKSLFTQLVDAGDRVEATPLFKSEGCIKAKTRYAHGCIEFRMEKTDELVAYLQGKNITI